MEKIILEPRQGILQEWQLYFQNIVDKYTQSVLVRQIAKRNTSLDATAAHKRIDTSEFCSSENSSKNADEHISDSLIEELLYELLSGFRWLISESTDLAELEKNYYAHEIARWYLSTNLSQKLIDKSFSSNLSSLVLLDLETLRGRFDTIWHMKIQKRSDKPKEDLLWWMEKEFGFQNGLIDFMPIISPSEMKIDESDIKSRSNFVRYRYKNFYMLHKYTLLVEILNSFDNIQSYINSQKYTTVLDQELSLNQLIFMKVDDLETASSYFAKLFLDLLGSTSERLKLLSDENGRIIFKFSNNSPLCVYN